MNDFLASEKNAGKAFVAEFRYDKIKGFEDKDIIIDALKNELFTIAQALVKMFQDATLEPLYFTKAVNGWPKDIYFSISSIILVMRFLFLYGR